MIKLKKQDIILNLLAGVMVVTTALKIMPPSIKDVPESLSATKGSSVILDYPSFYTVEVDNDNVKASDTENGIFIFEKTGESNIKLSSGLRTYNIKAVVEDVLGLNISIYDKSGVEATEITVRIGDTIYNMTSNQLLIPKDVKTGSDIVLITGTGDNTKQLLLATITNNDEGIIVTPQEPNTYIKSDRLYINLDLKDITQ